MTSQALARAIDIPRTLQPQAQSRGRGVQRRMSCKKAGVLLRKSQPHLRCAIRDAAACPVRLREPTGVPRGPLRPSAAPPLYCRGGAVGRHTRLRVKCFANGESSSKSPERFGKKVLFTLQGFYDAPARIAGESKLSWRRRFL